VPWVEVFAVLVICHLTGDYIAQTEWQAVHKYGGLSGNGEARRALFSHVTSYTLMFVPAFLWMASDLGPAVLAVVALVSLPHLVQDDGRLLVGYVRRFKRADVTPGDPLFMSIDQSFHMVVLFGVALLAHALA
jgi:hypothetical protein